MNTIFALASARGRAGVAVVRVSGPRALDAGRALAGSLPVERQAGLRVLRDATGQVLDNSLVLTFPAPHSFTGEDIVELHLHGSPAVQKAVLATLGDMADLRLAEPGEFTRRALENGKLDLAQVEGLADLIEAETEVQRRQALRVFSGELGKRSEEWRAAIIRALALLEAGIDFADEDVPEDVMPEVVELIGQVQGDLTREIAGTMVAERVRDGFEVAIVGPANVGKSTLLNALAGRDAAITSDIAGTTRDVIEVQMDLNGLPVTMLDTAGLRESRDQVEMIGMARAVERAETADLRVILIEREAEQPRVAPGPDDLVVVAKDDQGQAGGVSGLTGQGIDRVIAHVTKKLEMRVTQQNLATRERHRMAMRRAGDALDEAHRRISAGDTQAELVAEELRSAVRALDVLIGRVDVEDVLDEIFASFCLGK